MPSAMRKPRAPPDVRKRLSYQVEEYVDGTVKLERGESAAITWPVLVGMIRAGVHDADLFLRLSPTV